MRYVIQTNDEQGLIGIQIGKWVKEKKLEIIERSDTLDEINANLARVAAALIALKKVGYNSEVMEIYIQKKTGVGMADTRSMLYHQQQFLKAIGAMK
jgi:hypothetical protein